MGSSKKCEKSWKIYSVFKKWTLTMEKSSKSDVYQKKKKKCFKESQNFGRASRVSPKLRKIKDVEGLMFPFIYRVILRYSRSTKNGSHSSHIYGGVHHECERREHNFFALWEYLRIFPFYME